MFTSSHLSIGIFEIFAFESSIYLLNSGYKSLILSYSLTHPSTIFIIPGALILLKPDRDGSIIEINEPKIALISSCSRNVLDLGLYGVIPKFLKASAKYFALRLFSLTLLINR